MNNNLEWVKLTALEGAIKELPYQINEIASTDTEYIEMIFNDIMKSKEYIIGKYKLDYITDYGEIRVDFKRKAFYIYCEICDDSCNMIKWDDNVFKLMSQPLKRRISYCMRRAGIKIVKRNPEGRE